MQNKSQRTIIKDIERQVRSSFVYHGWAERNLGLCCLQCQESKFLQVHHVPNLYQIVVAMWKLYGNFESTLEHVINLHEAGTQNQPYGATLCSDCHHKIHKFDKTFFYSNQEVQIADWAVLPREMPGPFLHNSKTERNNGLTLIATQILGVLGTLILDGHLEEQKISFNKRNIAKRVGKTPGTSFNASLERGIGHLKTYGIIKRWKEEGPSVTLEISKGYLEQLMKNPWFLPIKELKTKRMTVFALRWHLLHQSGKEQYKVNYEKLANHLCLSVRNPAFVSKCVQSSIEEISWTTSSFEDGMFTFKMKKRGATPIHSLRSRILSSIRDGI